MGIDLSEFSADRLHQRSRQQAIPRHEEFQIPINRSNPLANIERQEPSFHSILFHPAFKTVAEYVVCDDELLWRLHVFRDLLMPAEYRSYLMALARTLGVRLRRLPSGQRVVTVYGIANARDAIVYFVSVPPRTAIDFSRSVARARAKCRAATKDIYTMVRTGAYEHDRLVPLARKFTLQSSASSGGPVLVRFSPVSPPQYGDPPEFPGDALISARLRTTHTGPFGSITEDYELPCDGRQCEATFSLTPSLGAGHRLVATATQVDLHLVAGTVRDASGHIHYLEATRKHHLTDVALRILESAFCAVHLPSPLNRNRDPLAVRPVVKEGRARTPEELLAACVSFLLHESFNGYATASRTATLAWHALRVPAPMNTLAPFQAASGSVEEVFAALLEAPAAPQ